VQLTPDLRCALFGQPERPAFCASLRPQESMCGANRDEALDLLRKLELATRPEARAEPRRSVATLGSTAHDA
jgi:hypothetical protein